MKKLISIILCILMVVALLCGCGEKTEDNTKSETSSDKLGSVTKGEYITFGTYEQDNNTENGKEDIEWLVLEVKDGKALVISKYALDCKRYHNIGNTNANWQTSTLRTWLNYDFLNTAFSKEEKTKIATTTVTADKNPEYITNPGNDTQDKVFLLSITELNEYFSSDSVGACLSTDYAVANGAFESDNGNCVWWLRSPGRHQMVAAVVDGNGDVRSSGEYVTRNLYAVRPALWIDLNS